MHGIRILILVQKVFYTLRMNGLTNCGTHYSNGNTKKYCLIFKGDM